MLVYGLFFGFGWLLHRQQQLLGSVGEALGHLLPACDCAWVTCRAIAGSEPHWGPFLRNGELAYTELHGGCVVPVVGARRRGYALSLGASPVASLSRGLIVLAAISVHLAALFFAGTVLQPVPLQQTVEVPGQHRGYRDGPALSYHYLVRFTFIE